MTATLVIPNKKVVNSDSLNVPQSFDLVASVYALCDELIKYDDFVTLSDDRISGRLSRNLETFFSSS